MGARGCELARSGADAGVHLAEAGDDLNRRVAGDTRPTNTRSLVTREQIY
jgi:hypothetical protein